MANGITPLKISIVYLGVFSYLDLYTNKCLYEDVDAFKTARLLSFLRNSDRDTIAALVLPEQKRITDFLWL